MVPLGVANRASESRFLLEVRSNARKMKGVSALRRENGRPLPTFDAV